VIFDSATGTLSWDRDGNGSAAAKFFATLQTGATILFSDIDII
jgi:hypothetical protein